MATAINTHGRVAILSATATPVGRLTAKAPELSAGLEQDILGPIVAQALQSAGIDRTQIDTAVFTQNPPTTQQLGFATFMAAQLGLRCTGQLCEVSQMGTTGGNAFDIAANDVLLGRARYALALGVVRQSDGDPAMAMSNGLRTVGDVDFQSPVGIPPIGWYALDAARYIHDTGCTRAEIAQVALKSRKNAIDNELAQFRTELSLDDVLQARPIVEPLGLLEVPARADGAICLLLCSEEDAAASGHEYVVVSGRGFSHEGFHQIGDQAHDMTAFPSATAASAQALANAGVKLADIDLAELYAPCTITEVLVSEAIGFAAKGKGVKLLLDGDTMIDGRIPINTSGGCLSRGHPPQITALYGLLELREQLLGNAGKRQVNNARLAMHCCELGNYNAALVHILETPA